MLLWHDCTWHSPLFLFRGSAGVTKTDYKYVSTSVCSGRFGTARTGRCVHGVDTRALSWLRPHRRVGRWRYCATPEVGTSCAFETSLAAGAMTYFTTKRAL